MLRLTFFAVLATVFVSTQSAFAQIEAPSFTGSFEVDGSPYSGGPLLWFSLAKISAGGSHPASSSVTLVPQPNLPDNTKGRSLLKFIAGGSGDLTQAQWMLPENGEGNMSAALAGESRIFNTWTPGWCIAPANNHSYRSEVSVLNPSTEAWVDIDIQEAPRPFLEAVNGDFNHGQLDNGGDDRDADPGKVLLDKAFTSVMNLDFDLPSFDMHRSTVFWQDFTESSSPFWDQTYSRAVVAFDGPSGFYTFASPISELVFFAPGEGDVSKTISGFSGSVSIDIGAILPGDYTVRYWAIPLTADFSDGTSQLGCAGGFVPIEHVEMNVRVVPEPATWLAMGAGLAALARSRRRRI